MPGRQVDADAVGRERRGGVLAGAGQRRRRGHAADRDGKVLRWDGLPSPDGNYIAHHDKNQQLWIFDVAKKTQTKVAESADGGLRRPRAGRPTASGWPTRRPAPNQLTRIYLYEVATGAHRRRSRPIATTAAARRGARTASGSTSCRTATSSRWSASPWGSRQPEPFCDRQTKIYHVALKRGERSPFQPDDELHAAEAGGEADTKRRTRRSREEQEGRAAQAAQAREARRPAVVVDVDGLETRLLEVPVPAGNYSDLSTDAKRLYFVSRPTGRDGTAALKTLALENKKPEPETFIEESAATSCRRRQEDPDPQGRGLLRRRRRRQGAGRPREDRRCRSATGRSSLDPRDEWRQMFTEAWRLERDYFYDRGMHGVDWPAMRAKYQPLVDRVTDRAELSDVLAQMVGELSALHIFVRGGDAAAAARRAWPASLGAHARARREGRRLPRRPHLSRPIPTGPDGCAPLAQAGRRRRRGRRDRERSTASRRSRRPTSRAAARPGRQAGAAAREAEGGRRRARRHRRADHARSARTTSATTSGSTRGGSRSRRRARTRSATCTCARWAAATWPSGCASSTRSSTATASSSTCATTAAATSTAGSSRSCCARPGSTGSRASATRRGTCSSPSAATWSCSSTRTRRRTARRSPKGFRRLGLGKVIGTRTWGGEIWLSSSNFLVDRGIATAAEIGVYGPEGAVAHRGPRRRPGHRRRQPAARDVRRQGRAARRGGQAPAGADQDEADPGAAAAAVPDQEVRASCSRRVSFRTFCVTPTGIVPAGSTWMRRGHL